MILGLCRGLSERSIRRAIRHGASSLDDLVEGCGAGSDCGSCLGDLERLLAEMRSAAAAPPCLGEPVTA